MLAEIYHYDPRLGELLERLEDVDVQPWVALREALVAVREARRWRSCRYRRDGRVPAEGFSWSPASGM